VREEGLNGEGAEVAEKKCNTSGLGFIEGT